MNIDRYEAIRLLGEGSFGKVYLMRDKVKRGLVCVKIIKIKNIPKKEREATKMEVDLLRKLHHPNIVRYVDSFLSKNASELCICMEYCDGGDLATQIKAAKKNLFSENKILHWFVQLALGLHYMHSNKVLHRDLKTQNVFLLGNGRLVLGDLGISKVLDGTMDFAQTCIGTPYYMSPEIFQNKPYSYKSDVWALGCVLYEMTTLNHAFDANSINGLAGKIIKGRYPPIHHKYSRHLRDLIQSMLEITPAKRPDIDQILRKPFIKKHTINFFTDIASRPSTSIGEGTMIIRGAVGGSGASNNLNQDANMLALQKQLRELDMTEAMSEALAPKNAPVDPTEAKKLAKEQASALKREEEHKRMVEVALEKMRQERQNRLKNRVDSGKGQEAKGVAPPRKEDIYRQPRGPSPAQLQNVPSVEAMRKEAQANIRAAANNPNILNEKEKEREREREREKERLREKEREKERERERERLAAVEAERRREKEQKERLLEREKKIAEEKRREYQIQQEREMKERERLLEDKKREDMRREAVRLQEESRLREEAVSKMKSDLAKQQADAIAKRDALREKERQRQREEIEQLKRDKIELDRRASERDRVREQQRRMSEEKADSRADDRDDISAKERVLLRKQEKMQRDENERIELLKEAENENRRIRAAAAAAANNQQRSHLQGEAVGASKEPKQMSANELSEKLKQATNGKANRFDAGPKSAYNEHSSNENTQRMGAIGSDTDEDVELDADDDALFERLPSNPDDEDEDMHRREEELQAELQMATLRCEELKRTLQETKTLMGDAPVGKKVVPTVPDKKGGQTTYANDDDDTESDDYYDDDEDENDKRAAPPSTVFEDVNATPRKHKPNNAAVRESPYVGLQDPPTPTGRLGDRIERLRQRCIEALTRDAFEDAYRFLKQYDDTYSNANVYEDDREEEKLARMRAILGDGKAHYTPLIEQLIFMEETIA